MIRKEELQEKKAYKSVSMPNSIKGTHTVYLVTYTYCTSEKNYSIPYTMMINEYEPYWIQFTRERIRLTDIIGTLQLLNPPPDTHILLYSLRFYPTIHFSNS